MPATSIDASPRLKALLRERFRTPKGRTSLIGPCAAFICRRIETDVHLRYRHLDGELTEEMNPDGFRYASLANCSIFSPCITIIQQEVDLQIHNFRDDVHAFMDPQVGAMGAGQLSRMLEEMVTQLRRYLQFREILTPNGHLVEHFDVTADRWEPFHEPTPKEPS